MLNEATREAVKLFLSRIARADKDGEVDEDLLRRLNDRSNEAVCKPEPQQGRPTMVSHPPPREEPRSKPAAAPRPPVVNAPPAPVAGQPQVAPLPPPIDVRPAPGAARLKPPPRPPLALTPQVANPPPRSN